MNKTDIQYNEALSKCRDIFVKKLHDYGASWRIMRPSSITDQIFIKAKRIRTLETVGKALVDEGIEPEFIGIINYGLIALIQLQKGVSDTSDIQSEEALTLYDNEAANTHALMNAKNHDYGEAWRSMRVSSFTDLILTKIARTKQIEDIGGKTLISEGIDANYRDMVNYAVFALIKLSEQNEPRQG